MLRPNLGQRIDAALHNTQARANFRSALQNIMAKRAAQFPDPVELEGLRDRAAAIRAQALEQLPALLARLEAKLRANGIQVHWAETPAEANRLIESILKAHSAKRVVKGKSMVSEEIGLNDHLLSLGYEVIESDLGEFIIQLAGEPPSHIVAPAMHKNRHEIARLFAEHFPDLGYTEDVDGLTMMARRIMREKFVGADAGISGVNFAVAETGTLCLVENEGNGRMCTTAPPLHIAITGIEKVVERLVDIPPLLSLLTRSATGQPITTYFNMISSPRREGERDGPQEVHLILLDNGRSRIHQDVCFRDTLRCIRCGACINHCPVYVQIGGHAYGSTYPGPIGSLIEPQRLGLEQAGNLTSLCTLCGACAEVCPVRIPLPTLINQLRAEGAASAQAGIFHKQGEVLAWRLWRLVYSQARLYRFATWLATRLSWLTPNRVGGWTRYRKAPKPAGHSLHELATQRGFDDV